MEPLEKMFWIQENYHQDLSIYQRPFYRDGLSFITIDQDIFIWGGKVSDNIIIVI
jgi:hypothetical protein